MNSIFVDERGFHGVVTLGDNVAPDFPDSGSLAKRCNIELIQALIRSGDPERVVVIMSYYKLGYVFVPALFFLNLCNSLFLSCPLETQGRTLKCLCATCVTKATTPSVSNLPWIPFLPTDGGVR